MPRVVGVLPLIMCGPFSESVINIGPVSQSAPLHLLIVLCTWTLRLIWFTNMNFFKMYPFGFHKDTFACFYIMYKALMFKMFTGCKFR